MSNTDRVLAHPCKEQLDGAQLLCPFSRNISVNVAVATLMMAIMPYHAVAWRQCPHKTQTINPGAESIIQTPPPCHGFNLPCCRVTGTPGNLLPLGRQRVWQPTSQAAPTAGAAAASDTRLWLSTYQRRRLPRCCKQRRRVCHRRCSWWQRHGLGPRPRSSRRRGHRGPGGRAGAGPGRRRTGSGSRARGRPSAGRRVGRCGRAGEGPGPRQGAGTWS